MKSLQQITDAWGQYMLRFGGGGVKFTRSTNYDTKELQKYLQYECVAQFVDLQYQALSSAGDPLAIPSQTLINNTSVPQTQTFTWSETKTASFTWSISEALQIGVSVTGKAKFPIPGMTETDVTASVDLTLSSTQSGTATTQQTWGVQQPVEVPAHKRVVCQSTINRNKASTTYTSRSKIEGYVAIWFNNKVNDHWLWFHPIGDVFSTVTSNNLIDCSGYEIVNSKTINATTTGQFTCEYGIDVITVYTEYPIDAAMSDAEISRIWSYTVGAIRAEAEKVGQ